MIRTVTSVVSGAAAADAPGGLIKSTNPARTSEVVAEVRLGDATTFVDAAKAAKGAQPAWADVPAPVRGRAIAHIGRLVEANAEALARLRSDAARARDNSSVRRRSARARSSGDATGPAGFRPRAASSC